VLEGRFFLTRDDEAKLEHHGEVVARVQEGVYLVQLFDWHTGAASSQLVIDIDRMMDEQWELFDTRAALNAMTAAEARDA
jgi:hypothetical protein